MPTVPPDLHSHNPYPNLLTLKIEAVADRLGLHLQSDRDVFPVIDGWVRLGLMGLHLSCCESPTQPTALQLQSPQDLHQQQPQVTWLGQPPTPGHTAIHYRALTQNHEGLRGTWTLGQIRDDVRPDRHRSGLDVSVTPADLRIMEAEGLWHHDISPNHHGILERLVVKHL